MPLEPELDADALKMMDAYASAWLCGCVVVWLYLYYQSLVAMIESRSLNQFRIKFCTDADDPGRKPFKLEELGYSSGRCFVARENGTVKYLEGTGHPELHFMVRACVYEVWPCARTHTNQGWRRSTHCSIRSSTHQPPNLSTQHHHDRRA